MEALQVQDGNQCIYWTLCLECSCCLFGLSLHWPAVPRGKRLDLLRFWNESFACVAALWSNNIDPENNKSLVETNLPTLSGRLYLIYWRATVPMYLSVCIISSYPGIDVGWSFFSDITKRFEPQ